MRGILLCDLGRKKADNKVDPTTLRQPSRWRFHWRYHKVFQFGKR
jgi:hypothetical protein